jgi:hypothetical protein
VAQFFGASYFRGTSYVLFLAEKWIGLHFGHPGHDHYLWRLLPIFGGKRAIFQTAMLAILIRNDITLNIIIKTSYSFGYVK